MTIDASAPEASHGAGAELPKTFDPAEAEPRISHMWEASGAYQPSDDPDAEPYAIMLPPPNVTGSLHVGHALNHTLQDVLIRFERMRGKAVLWQPGMDHAGIATQMVVERQLAEEGIDRRDLGREAFLERVWAWKDKSGGMILEQDRRLGSSFDRTRERFTMDEGLSAAVRKVFVQLHEEGLLYRDKRLVNWDPKFQTAISDLEVENREVPGHFWHLRYPLADGVTFEFPVEHDEAGVPTKWETRDHVVVATTRPETMLADMAVAVHPDDERYAGLVGKHVMLPIVNRPIPIVADEHADPEKGSGAVKITPAHDFNDFEVGKRAGIAPGDMLNILDVEARLVTGEAADASNLPDAVRGLDRYDARDWVVDEMERLGLLALVEDKPIEQPFGDRSNVVIEPFLTDQWYVDAPELAKEAIAAVKDGRTRFVPETWAKTYFNWMDNIQPWCVSRQLWWGHRIPAWYGPDGQAFVAEDEAGARAKAKAAYGEDVDLTQDPDVLDTWFSSALWPFSTLGWPDDSDPALKRFYPQPVLVTGFDIIFFWVARMMMQGLHFMKDVPFKDVYMHALVRDEHGQKMSKSKGNVLDPIELIDEFGADAVRFTLTAMAAQGRDIRLSKDRIAGYRNFGTKVWNAARFARMNGCAPVEGFDPAAVAHPVNRWIVGETAKTAAAVTAELETYRFNEAAGAVYRFAWNLYCDWYLELIKPLLQGEDEAAKAETRACAGWVLDQLLALLHPFSPFVTEELWALTAGEAGRSNPLIVQAWPNLPDALRDDAVAAEVDWVIALVTAVRSVKAEMGLAPGAKVPASLVGASAQETDWLGRWSDQLLTLARLESLSPADAAPKGAIQTVVGAATLALDVAGVIDLGAEKARLTKEIAKTQGEIDRLVKKLGNERFVANAPAEVVEAERAKQTDYEAQKTKLEAALSRLDAVG